MNENVSLPNSLLHKNENKYFWLVLTISIISYIVLALSIVGIIILLGILLISVFLNALMIGNIRSNAIKLSPVQFPEVYKTAEILCGKMGVVKVPDIYVIQSEGALNAFATRFFSRNMVVIYSEIFELVSTGHEEELNFVLAHELAHIKRNHLMKQMFILPAMWIPGIAELYLRACEYTCDRYAAYYTENSDAAKNSLMMLAIGKQLYSQVNKDEYIKQLNDEKGFFVWLSQALSTHPSLPKRISELDIQFGTSTTGVKPNKFKIVWLVPIVIIMASIFVVTIGSYYVFDKVLKYASFEDGYEEEYYEEQVEISPLIMAVANGEIEQVNTLIQNGEDLLQEDYNGNTALDWAVKTGNNEMVELLVNAGINVNYESSYGMTALMTAAEMGDPDMVRLLIEHGGDPNYQEYSGMTALFYAIYSTDLETVQVLLELGADPDITDFENMTAYMNALQLGERDIANIIKEYQ